ncbi:unnamed protein product [Closterium sp. NIES-54]
MSFAMLLVWVYNFSSGASPGVTAFRDSLDSCVGVGLAYNGMHSMSFFRGIACSDLVNTAAIRGKAGFDKGSEIHYRHILATGGDSSNTSGSSIEVGTSSGTRNLSSTIGYSETENPERDGCQVLYNSSVDPRDIKPTSSFNHSGCQIEWITFSTRCGKGVQRLAKFCDLVGVPFAILGLNETWKGLGGRVRYYREYLRTLPRDRIVIVTDADDVLFLPNRELCGPNQLVKAFLSVNAPVVFGAEIFAYPTVDVIPFYGQKLKYPFPNRHLNAGSCIGFAWALSEMIDATYTSDCMEDQRQFVTGYLAQPYLFNSLPRTPYPETNFTSLQSLILQQTALTATSEAATSSLTPTPGNLKYLCALPGPLQDLIPEDVTPEKLEAARQAAPPPFIKLDHYNALMELLGGRRFEQFEVQGTGSEIKVYSRVTKAPFRPRPSSPPPHAARSRARPVATRSHAVARSPSPRAARSRAQLVATRAARSHARSLQLSAANRLLLLPACLLLAACCLPAAAACCLLLPAAAACCLLPACCLPAACLQPACCLPAACCLLPACCSLPATCLLPAYCLPAACCLLQPACRLPAACLLPACCLLPAACLLLLPAAACCLLLLPAACCLLPACCCCLLPAASVCCLLPAASCLKPIWRRPTFSHSSLTVVPSSSLCG